MTMEATRFFFLLAGPESKLKVSGMSGKYFGPELQPRTLLFLF